MPDLDESVLEFVAEFTGAELKQLTSTSTLLGDLGVDGDDGYELIQNFGEKFKVDLSSFEGNRHFGPEAGCFPPLFLWQLVRMAFRTHETPEEQAGLDPIRIADLIEAAKKKAWSL